MTTYDGESHENWMNGLGSMDRWNRKHLLAMFALLDVPGTYLDVGCGNGRMVNVAKQLGVDAFKVSRSFPPGVSFVILLGISPNTSGEFL